MFSCDISVVIKKRITFNGGKMVNPNCGPGAEPLWKSMGKAYTAPSAEYQKKSVVRSTNESIYNGGGNTTVAGTTAALISSLQISLVHNPPAIH